MPNLKLILNLKSKLVKCFWFRSYRVWKNHVFFGFMPLSPFLFTLEIFWHHSAVQRHQLHLKKCLKWKNRAEKIRVSKSVKGLVHGFWRFWDILSEGCFLIKVYTRNTIASTIFKKTQNQKSYSRFWDSKNSGDQDFEFWDFLKWAYDRKSSCTPIFRFSNRLLENPWSTSLPNTGVGVHCTNHVT